MKNKVLAIIAILMLVIGPRIVDAAADTGEKPSDDGFITISERTYYDEELDAEIGVFPALLSLEGERLGDYAYRKGS